MPSFIDVGPAVSELRFLKMLTPHGRTHGWTFDRFYVISEEMTPSCCR